MTVDQKGSPAGVRAMSGVVHKRSPLSVAETVLRLTSAIQHAGGTPYFVVDHSGEAHRAGTELRDTKLVGFSDPRSLTPILAASPLAALDLPLRLLVWMDDNGTVWMSYTDPAWLTKRHRIPTELTASLEAVNELTTQLATDNNEKPADSTVDEAEVAEVAEVADQDTR
ncbi:uncharacterized protein (DUF302 family) [Kribbella antiqua]|uniref:Uncharacterized protein (DUF302 family) n=1 Tax=Kribbella antiqua TaxID=2512217 RepID=A0A4R2J362_9ACTN|nr:DUF302 domain-containing protein [Kribbella antiqua]TCO51288.1 uncharacterized protein (DUF302 family) [Kribbella antiqua]